MDSRALSLLLAAFLTTGTAFAQTHTPPNVRAVKVGATLSCALIHDGTVRCWGSYPVEELYGDNFAGPDPIEPRPIPDVDDATDLAVGRAHACALHHNGTVRCWGVNDAGQLGLPRESASSPGANVPGVQGARAIAAGGDTTCAIVGDGAVWCWGDALAPLRDPQAGPRGNAPARVEGVDHAAQVAVGDAHVCARLQDGTVRCWGRGVEGQLGDGQHASVAAPVTVRGVARVVDLSVGGLVSCAVIEDGAVRCWGSNAHASLGIGLAGGDRAVAEEVVGLRDAVEVSAGGTRVCARVRDGSVRCWGDNPGFSLGDGTALERARPVVLGWLRDAAQLSTGTGREPLCAVLRDGGLRCGPAREGFSRYRPVAVGGLDHVEDLVARGDRTCARLQDGTARCWGRFAQRDWVHDGADAHRAEPHRVQGLRDVAELAAGDQHTCARMNDGKVRCWGDHHEDQFVAPTDRLAQWAEVPGIVGSIAIAAGGDHTCVVALDGTVRCWGENLHGELGDGATTSRAEPAPVQGIRGATAVAAGSAHTCALLQDGSVRCWGDFLGEANVRHLVPVPVRGLSGVTRLVASGSLTCALKADGALGCWGVDRFSSSDGAARPLPTPTWIAERVRSVAIGERHLCALGQGGALSCWGRDVAAPRVRAMVDVSAGAFHTCVRTSFGKVSCWGDNQQGQSGVARVGATAVAVRAAREVSLPASAAQVVAGRHHTCARQSDGTVWCWGREDAGQLGNGPSEILTPAALPNVTGLAGLSLGAHDLFGITSQRTVLWWQAAIPALRLVREAAADFTGARAVEGLTRVVAATSRELVSYAVRDDGTLWSWGYGSRAKGGLQRLPPFQLQLRGVEGLTGVASSAGHMCTWSTAGAWCWGANGQGQVGDGTRGARVIPTRVRGLTNVTELALSQGATCALLRDGTVRCWGDNRARLLGNERWRAFQARPVPLEGVDHVTRVVMGAAHACALRDDGHVWCWGRNDQGQLGRPELHELHSPAPVSGVSDAIAIAAGDAHTCVVRRDHTVACWGGASRHQLGQGLFMAPQW